MLGIRYNTSRLHSKWGGGGMVDAADLKSAEETRVGSTPTRPILQEARLRAFLFIW